MSFNNRLSSARLAIRPTSLSWLTRSKSNVDSPRRCDIPPVTASNWQNRDGLQSGVTLLLVSCYDVFARSGVPRPRVPLPSSDYLAGSMTVEGCLSRLREAIKLNCAPSSEDEMAAQ
jgi:hypothetical protein